MQSDLLGPFTGGTAGTAEKTLGLKTCNMSSDIERAYYKH